MLFIVYETCNRRITVAEEYLAQWLLTSKRKMASRDNLDMMLLGLSALLQGIWPKTTLLSKACHNLLFYGTCGPYHNVSIGCDSGPHPPTVLF